MAIQEKQILDDQAVVFREGQPADKVYLIVQGNVSLHKITKKGVQKLSTCGVGEFIGVNAMLDDVNYDVTAKVEGAAVVIPIERIDIQDQFVRLNKLTLNMIKSVIKRHNKLLEEKVS